MERPEALVVGAGPAGLMAAEEMARAGLQVCVAEAKPSMARKLLMAGKSGLNLTTQAEAAAFLAAYGAAAPRLRRMLADFGPDQVRHWAEGLGQPLFTGSSGRVFPLAMKASPLLRAWLARLAGLGVEMRPRWRWQGWSGAALAFETPEGERCMAPGVVVLALGGASWARLGSDGAWADLVAARGVPLAPFAPSNAALSVDWSAHMARHFGQPVKPLALMAGGQRVRGEIVVSAKGLEGGGLYPLTPALRKDATLTLDLAPDLAEAAVAERLAQPRGKRSQANHLRRTLRLDPVRLALLNEFARPLPQAPRALAARIKALPVAHAGLRPLDEAISTAGGVRWDGLTDELELRALPGVFAAGEMLDWEAPTGGYLLTACLATGRCAGRAAAARLRSGPAGGT
jgi:hypothetical protein